MEVRALEGYSAVHTLQEMLTIKSDDVTGRNKTYENVIKGNKLRISGLPESFNLVMYLFKGLGQNIEPLTADRVEAIHKERVDKILKLGLRGITSPIGIDEAIGDENEDQKLEDKKEMIENVITELEDFGEIE